jgi:hypothetical protein
LREARRVIAQFEQAGGRYVAVAKENKRLKKDLEALNDDAFWEDLEEMKANSEESTALLRGASDTLREVYSAFPSLEPAGVLAHIDSFFQRLQTKRLGAGGLPVL